MRRRPLPALARAGLLIAVGTALAVEVALWVAEGSTELSAFLDAFALVAIGMFAWRPAIAVTALVAGGVAALFFGDAAPYVLAMALATGLAIATCSAVPAVVFVVATVALTVVGAWSDPGFTDAGAWICGAITLASGLLGAGFTRMVTRQRALESDVGSLQREAAVALQNERDRIADELHNTIAHDLTVVSMHAKALAMTSDPVERSASERIIAESAHQALTDMRRMLRTVQHAADPLLEDPRRQTLDGAIDAVVQQLNRVGVTVDTKLPSPPPSLAHDRDHSRSRRARSDDEHHEARPRDRPRTNTRRQQRRDGLTDGVEPVGPRSPPDTATFGLRPSSHGRASRPLGGFVHVRARRGRLARGVQRAAGVAPPIADRRAKSRLSDDAARPSPVPGWTP